MSQRPKALVFDLGGVLIEIDFVPALTHWAKFSRLSATEIMDAFTMDEMYCSHERGEISFTEYAEHLKQTFQLDCSYDQILTGWNSIFKDEYAAVIQAIGRISDDIPVAILSNSNQAHQDFWQKRYAHFLSRFNPIFVSSEIQCRKPEPACFDYVARKLNCAFSEMIFFDDTLENIEGARNMGIESIHVTRPERVVDTLSAQGLLTKS